MLEHSRLAIVGTSPRAATRTHELTPCKNSYCVRWDVLSRERLVKDDKVPLTCFTGVANIQEHCAFNKEQGRY